jgi:hypothetical protein
MKQPFLRFEDGKISLGGKDLLVKSAQLSVEPSLEPQRVYGEYDSSVAGARTEFVDFSPQGGLRGKLGITFVINGDFFSANSIDRLFDISAGMSETPINENKVGRYLFNYMYLKSLSFSITPFKVIEAKADYDIYGTIKQGPAQRFSKTSIDPAHGLKSFGEVKAGGQRMDSHADGQFEVTNLNYNILVGRKIHHHIRDSENTTINTKADGVVPQRVSVENIEISMTVEGNEIVENLNPMGNVQAGTTTEKLEQSSISAYLYSLRGKQLARFSCTGRIMSQSLVVSEGQYSKGKISIQQIVK